MRLSDKIKVGIEEVGHLVFECKEDNCLERKLYLLTHKDNIKYYGRLHCREQIPYVIRKLDDIKLYDLCTHKIEQYWQK